MVCDMPHCWTDSEIADYYDTHPDITLEHLAFATGRKGAELKEILMS